MPKRMERRLHSAESSSRALAPPSSSNSCITRRHPRRCNSDRLPSRRSSSCGAARRSCVTAWRHCSRERPTSPNSPCQRECAPTLQRPTSVKWLTDCARYGTMPHSLDSSSVGCVSMPIARCWTHKRRRWRNCNRSVRRCSRASRCSPQSPPSSSNSSRRRSSRMSWPKHRCRRWPLA